MQHFPASNFLISLGGYLTTYRYILLVLFLLLISNFLKAQNLYKSGYVTKADGETVLGKIFYDGDLLIQNKIKFQDSTGSINVLEASNIIDFRINESHYFTTKSINGQEVLLEFIFHGAIDIYYQFSKSGDLYFIQKDTLPLIPLAYQKSIEMIDDKAVMKESTKHIGILRYYMSDAPEIASDIEKIAIPQRGSLIKLASKYHETIDSDKKYEIYAGKQNLFFAVEPDFRLLNLNSLPNTISDYGVLLYIGAGSLINFSLKTGISFLQVEYQTDSSYFNEAYKRIPVNIYYQFNHFRVRPFFSLGANLIIGNDIDEIGYYSNITPGLNFLITKNISTSLSYDLIYRSDYFDYRILGNSFNFGVRYQL